MGFFSSITIDDKWPVIDKPAIQKRGLKAYSGRVIY
jgi:hypothetical protein